MPPSWVTSSDSLWTVDEAGTYQQFYTPGADVPMMNGDPPPDLSGVAETYAAEGKTWYRLAGWNDGNGGWIYVIGPGTYRDCRAVNMG